MIQLPPGVLARTDQDHARLQDLARVARRHAKYCPRPHMCPGAGVEAFIEDTPCGERDRLLLLAIAELAARGYGERHA